MRLNIGKFTVIIKTLNTIIINLFYPVILKHGYLWWSLLLIFH
jgi:hypothetical protein